jgi:PAS domain S-box-containing protein
MSDYGLRALLLADDPDCTQQVQAMLNAIRRSPLSLAACCGVREGISSLKQYECDVVLLDMDAPSAAEALRQLREVDAEVPVVLLCAADAEEAAELLIAQGADDYLSKDAMDGRTLSWCVRHAVGRYHSERAVRRERALLRTLIDQLPDHIYVKDTASRFVLNNSAHLQFLGAASQEQIAGMTDRDVFPAAIGDVFFAEEQAIMRTGEPLISREERNVDSAGNEHWVSSTKVPRRDESGQIIGLVGMSRDITKRKANESRLRDQHARLEEAHQQLKEAQSQLVQSEKLAGLGQLVAGVAHEINNPLAFVTNNIAVLQRDLERLSNLLHTYREGDRCLASHEPALWERVRDSAERMDLAYTLANVPDLLARSRNGLQRIQEIVKGLCDFAHLNASEFQNADLNADIVSTLTVLADAARKKNIRLEQSPGVIPRVKCSAVKINQVIMNLVTNAIEASPNGGRIIVRSRTSGPDHVEVLVSDDGPGIDLSIRDRIFDPFFTTKGPGQGPGLGLSISYGVVREHGGEISFESAPGQGTTFIVRLPLLHNR